jgi:hypothetical protein
VTLPERAATEVAGWRRPWPWRRRGEGKKEGRRAPARPYHTDGGGLGGGGTWLKK